MKNKFLLFMGMMIFLIGIASASYFVNDPENCPNSYMAQTCSGSDLVCGYSSGITYCYDMSGVSAPWSSATSTTSYSGSYDGGYILDCYAYDSSEPHCDNSGGMWCDRDSSCYNVHRITQCEANKWSGDASDTSCTTCISGYTYCDGSYTDDDGCEVRYGVTNCAAGANNNINSTCDCVCDSGYLDCDASGAGAGNGCEVHDGGSCTVGSLSGTYSGCTCVVDKSYFETGTFVEYLINKINGAMLWFKNWGTGDLINATNVDNKSFRVDNETSVYTDGYYYGQPNTGSIGSGIIEADEFLDCGCMNISDDGIENVTYPTHKHRIVHTDGTTNYCTLAGDTVTVTASGFTVYYVDSSCTVQSDTFSNYYDLSIHPGNYSRIFDVYKSNGVIEESKGATLIELTDRKIRRLNVNCGAGGHLTICNGMNIQENTFPYFNQTEGDYVHINTEVPTTNESSETDGMHFVYRSGGTWIHADETGINLTHCDDGSDLVECSDNKYRRYFVGSIGWETQTKIHQLAALDSESFKNIGDCLDTINNPLPDSYFFPPNDKGILILHHAYCGRRDDAGWTGSWMDLREGIEGFGVSQDLSIFVTTDGTRPLTDNWDAGAYNITASWFKGIFNWIIGATSTNYLTFNGTQLDFDESALNATIDARAAGAEVDPLWTGNSSSVARIGNCPAGQVVMNTTTGGVQCVVPPAGDEVDPLWSGNQSSYSTTAEILAFGYYNATDFVITDYFTKSDIIGFGYYNSTDFDIADYFTSAEVLAFDYYNSTDFSISDYFTSAEILGFNYYNSTDFSISDYYTKTQINNFGYYNLTDFDISDYATNVKVDSLGNWSADKSSYWDTADDLDTVISTDEITELKIDFNTACAAGNHLYVSGNNLACEADDDTTYTAGDHLTLDGTEFDVDDDFLLNIGDTGAGDYVFDRIDVNDDTTGRYAVDGNQAHATGHGIRVETIGDTSDIYVAKFGTYTTAILNIKGDGKVGIGTQSPAQKLEVSNPDTGSGNTYLRISKGYTSAGAERVAGIILGTNAADNANTWRIEDSSSLGYMNAGNLNFVWRARSIDYPRVSFLSDGKVGIGTQSPAQKLEVVGNIEASGTICDSGGTNCIGGVGGSGAANHIAYWTDANTLSYDNNQLYWDAANNQLGIGTSTPGYILQVEGNIQADEYWSGDGTQGMTDTCGGMSTVKDGLVTSCTGTGIIAWTCSGIHFDSINVLVGTVSKLNGVLTVNANNLVVSANVDLPHGVTIVTAEVHGNNAATAETWNLERVLLTTGDHTVLASANIGSVGGTISNPVVDNNNYAYFFQTSSLDTDDMIFSAKVRYEV